MEHEHETPELDQEFDPVFEEEQQHLTETYAKLQTMGRDLLAKMEANSKDAAADKLAMVDELSVNLASYADAMETYADFATVNRVIDAYNLAQTVDAEKLTSIQVLLKQPYFAKVVLQMKPGQEPKELYIGTAGIADENYRRLVVDWRSPVAEVYYNQENGPTSYEANGRTIRVDLKLRRQFDIEADRLNAYFDTTVAIQDAMLLASLSKRRTAQMQAITATIQKEQNAIIRNTRDKIMVIQGAAGSGKTSIALHRIAYLLYHDRKNLKSSNILILSPNSIFSDYISHILPELGEENIKEMSFDLFAYRQLKDTVSDCEDRYDQIERSLNFPDMPSLYKEKQSREFLNQMEGYLTSLEDELMDFHDVEYKSFTKKEEEIIDLFYFKFQDIPLLSRMEAVAENFIDEVETLRDNDMDEEERAIVMEKFMNMYETQDLYVIYSRFLESCGYPGLPHVQLQERKLRYEDVYPVLYMKYRLLRQTSHNGIKHLVVDEMQDYSRLQYLILKMMFPCRMTILGDKAQTMEDEAQDVLGFLPKIFGKDIRRIVMNKSYRNTVEIASYANQLAGITDMDLFDRHGQPVEELFFKGKKQQAMEAALDELVNKLQLGAEQFETAAVILRTESEAKEAARILKEKLENTGFDIENRFSYLHRDSTSFCKGLTVTTFYLAKGLEFDQVFSLFPAADQSPIAKQGRYIAATRALHKLHMYEYGK